jgi:glucose-1-phosphate adenylyltransferase
MAAKDTKVLAFVLAGGEGRRLRPLTRDICKPALPFGDRHRIVDFALGNLVNSGITCIYVAVQYRPQVLVEHLRRAWEAPVGHGGGVAAQIRPVRPPVSGAYRGTIDAVAHNLELIGRTRPDVVAIFGADHVYRMDVRPMLSAHQASHADVTVATIPVPRGQASQFGIVETSDDLRITCFREKPASTAGMPGRPTHALASMGNYLFAAEVLRDELRRARADGLTDFGGHLLPRLAATHRVFAYDFARQEVPGVRAHEERAYWRDVGTIDAYFDAHMDMLGPAPRFAVENPLWPIRATRPAPEPSRRFDAGGRTYTRSVLYRGTRVEANAVVEESVLMEGAVVGAGAHVCRAILEPGCVVPPGATIGCDAEADRAEFTVSGNGVVVVPRDHFVAATRQARGEIA